MPTKPTGNVRKNGNGYSARVRIGERERPSFEIAARSDGAADGRAAILADLAKRLRPVAGVEEIRIIVGAAGKARTEQGLREAVEAAEAIIRGEALTAAGAAAPTFEAFAKDWTSGELRKNHPDHVRDKDSRGDEQVLRLHISPHIGPKRVPDVTLDDCERVMRELPRDLAPATRRQIAQCMRKVLSLAVYPGRYIAANPIPREWMPKLTRSGSKAKAYLYPAEDAMLLACPKVPLERRIAYGVLAREGLRASELELLKWRDVDLEHGRIRLDANKTDDPRAWALSGDVARALAWWKKRTGGEAGDFVVRANLHHGARFLRGAKDDIGDLRRAGVTRPELFERSKTRQPLRLHDLRATFVTVSLASGRTEQWVSDRTGHKSSAMIATYTRQARQWSELHLGAFQALDELLPEMADEGTSAPPSAQTEAPQTPEAAEVERAREWATGDRTGELSGALDSRSSVFSEVPCDPAFAAAFANPLHVGSNPILTSPRGPLVAHSAPPPGPPTDAELERGILDAVRLGLGDVARTLSAQLEERRMGRAGNVVALDRKRRG